MVERVRLQQEPNRDPAELRFEEKMLQGEVVFSKQTTLREVVDYKGRDSMGLLDVPTTFEARDLGESILYVVSFPKTVAFHGGKLVEVLEQAKPGRVVRLFSQKAAGIIADWVILDEKRKNKIGYLYNGHTAPESKIAKEFSEFEVNHFPQFWDELHHPKPSIREIEDNLDNHVSSLMSTKKALATYGFDFFKSNYGEFAVAVRSVFPETFGLGLIEFLKTRGFGKCLFDQVFNEDRFKVSSISRDQWYDGIFNRIRQLFKMLSDEEVGELITDFHNQLSDEEKRELTMSAIKQFSPAHYETVLVDEDTGDIDKYWLSYPSIEKTEDNPLEIRHWESHESYVRFAFVLDEKTGFKEPKVIEKYIVAQGGGVAPIIIWERDKATREAEYFCRKIPQELITTLPHLFSENHDTLVGQLVVADYSDDVRKDLPEELPLREGGRKQRMMDAQMPVFVKLFSQAYLNRSPVILGFEKLGHKR